MHPRNKSLPEGYPANFTCKATGIPEPKLSWKFNDGELPSDVNQTNISEGSLLELSNVTKDKEGTYMCTATNKADATTSSATLHVFGKQKKTKFLSQSLLLSLFITITIPINHPSNFDSVNLHHHRNPHHHLQQQQHQLTNSNTTTTICVTTTIKFIHL